MTVTDVHVDRLLEELHARANAELAEVEAAAAAGIAKARAAAGERCAARQAEAMAACDAEETRRRANLVAEARRSARATLLAAQHAFVDRVLDRVTELSVARFRAGKDEEAIQRRTQALAAFARTPDVRITRADTGLTLVADDGHLRIDDDVAAWLGRRRAQLAIDICRAVEKGTC